MNWLKYMYWKNRFLTTILPFVVLISISLIFLASPSNNQMGRYANELNAIIDDGRHRLSSELDTPLLISSGGHGNSDEYNKLVQVYFPQKDTLYASLAMRIGSDAGCPWIEVLGGRGML